MAHIYAPQAGGFKCWNSPWNLSRKLKEENMRTVIRNGLGVINFVSEHLNILLLGSALSKQKIGGFSICAFSESLLRWSDRHSKEDAAGRKKGLWTEVLKEGRHIPSRQMESFRSQRVQSLCLIITRPETMTALLRTTGRKSPLNWVTRGKKASKFIPASKLASLCLVAHTKYTSSRQEKMPTFFLWSHEKRLYSVGRLCNC